MKTKILFIMHMPPPVHGAAMVGEWIHNSKSINEEFECYYINPSVSTRVSEVGKLKIKKVFLFITLLYKILRTIRKVRPNICYYTPTSDGWGIYRDALTISLMKLYKIKILLHFHNKGVKKYSSHKFAKIAYRIIFKDIKIILLAKELYEDVNAFIKTENVYILPNGIPQTISESEYQNIINERQKGSDKNRILYLSNMMSEKGIWVLLEACKLLKTENIKFECHYIGNWGDTTSKAFQEEINKRELQNYVFVHGPKYNNEKQEYLMNSDIFVFPTFYHGETFGLVLLEAMEYGLPCITTPEGGIPSFIHQNKNGILVSQNNPQELYIAIKDLIINKERRIQLGQEGRKLFIQKYTIKEFENNLIGILNTVSH